MNIKKYISLAGIAFPLCTMAQVTSNVTLCDFETADSYASVGVYDTWAQSPFRTGRLTGNAAVVDNDFNTEDPLLGYAPNTSSKVLAVQRSRYGSNTFGALVTLKEPFALKRTTQYVHVNIYTPKGGSVLLIGLGNRDDRPWQPATTEQFWAKSITKVNDNAWSDAVFAVSGADGITIRKLLVVVDCNSTHNLSEDFAAYVDNIVLSPSKDPFFSSTPYVLNFDESLAHTRTERYTTSISFTGSNSGTAQTLAVNQNTVKKVYIKHMENTFLASPGEKITTSISAVMSWMCGYAYIDFGNDGKFNVTYDDNSVTDKGDLVSYSMYKNYNSDGSYVSGEPSRNPPAFTIPADTKPGFYRLRYKVDWDNVDPGGNISSGNHISSNGGVIVDTRINIHNSTVNLSRATDALGGGLNGDILLADETSVTDKTAPFGEALTVKVKPAPGFKFSHLRIRHGYNLDGDSVVYGNTQWEEVDVKASQFTDDTYTIPASVIDGDVQFVPYFSNSGTTPEPTDDYAINYDEDQAHSRSDRYTTSVSLTGTDGKQQTLAVNQQTAGTLYMKRLDNVFLATPGEKVTPGISGQMNWMAGYTYIDLGQDGKFDVTYDDNSVTDKGDLMSYSQYKDYDSDGNYVSGEPSLDPPAFTIPASAKPGIYRMRYKVDWDNVDPGGSTVTGNPITNNGGSIVDTRINIHAANVSLYRAAENDGDELQGDVLLSDGSSVVGKTAPFGEALTIKVAPSRGYEFQHMTVRHGYNLDGEASLHGNLQWQETDLTADLFTDGSYTLPASLIDGDVRFLPVFTIATGIDGTTAHDGLTVTTETGKMHLTSAAAQDVTVCDLHGQTVFRGTVEGTRTLSLLQGIYVVNGQKVVVP